MPAKFLSDELRARKLDVCALENALVDLLIEAEDDDLSRLRMTKGIMQLVAPEIQENALHALSHRKVTVEIGGSAANALRGLAILGAKTAYSSVVGRDRHADAFRKRLVELGIKERLNASDKPTGTCVVLVTPDGERTMNTHLGACQDYQKSLVPVDDIRAAKIFFTTGYVWDTPGQVEAIEHAICTARAAKTRIALDVADPFAVGRTGARFRELMRDGAIDVLFANADEAQMLVACRGADAAAKIGEHVPVVVVKAGSAGAYVCDHGKVHHVPANAAKVVDTTGAGDMFAGGFLFGLVNGFDVETCGRIGCILAGDTIGHMGVRLSADIGARVARAVGAEPKRVGT